ncbi:MAG: tetratricopeptide repeat protein [Armatimonadota bacterium]|nr:tetratricopeptide repeat protein [Armatimonadota bacterium]
METVERKLVFAPFGADMFGEDILLFEHGLLLALETAVEMAGGIAYADVHSYLDGPAKRERPVPPLTETQIRDLAAKAECAAVVDGVLTCARHPETAALAQIAASLRIFFAGSGEFVLPDGFSFKAFSPEARPEELSVDFDLFIALQYRMCEEFLLALGVGIPPAFTAETLQRTRSWPAYIAFLKGKRVARTPETKLGYYEQALQHDPDFFDAFYNSAMLYKTQTNYELMRKRLLRAAALTTNPRDLGDVYFELGLASIFLGDTKTARNFWEQALEYADENPSLYVNMAGTFEQEENWQEAIRLNEEALERFPEYHKAIVNLGRLYAMLGHLDRAIPLYERALELQPDDALRRSVLGGCLLASGQEDEARIQFERAVELDPDSDPGKYAAQELKKLGPASQPPENEESMEDASPKKKRWGLF